MTLSVLSPAIAISYGPPTLSGLSTTFHCPSFATAETFCPWIPTVTVSPSEALPHRGTSLSRWSTAFSQNSACGTTSAPAQATKPNTTDNPTSGRREVVIIVIDYQRPRWDVARISSFSRCAEVIRLIAQD